jgi:phosphoglycolate phosphatase
MVRDYHQSVARGELPRPPRNEALFPGARETLDRLDAEGYLLAIVTSRSNRRLLELPDEQGIAGRFVTVKTVDHGPGKPNPYLLLQAMSEAGVARGNAVMIGDTTFDILMARNAGTAAIGVSWGVHEVAELHAAGAHRVVETFDHLPPTIGALLDRAAAESA